MLLIDSGAMVSCWPHVRAENPEEDPCVTLEAGKQGQNIDLLVKSDRHLDGQKSLQTPGNPG